MQATSDWFNAIKERNHNAVSKHMKSFQGTKNPQGETGLMQAVRARDIQMVKLLAPLEAGIFNNENETALMLAARIDFADGAKYLHSLEGHLHNQDGQTALMIASMNDCSSVIRRLMPESRYDVDSLGRTALVLAAEANAIEAMRALTTHTNMIYDTDSPSAIVSAIIKNNHEALSYLSEFVKESGESLRLSTAKTPGYGSKGSSASTPQDNLSNGGFAPETLKQVLDQEIDSKLAILERRITELRDHAGANMSQKRALENQVETLNNVLVAMNHHRDKLEAQISRGSASGRRKSSTGQMRSAPRSGSIASSARASSTARPPTGPGDHDQEANSPHSGRPGSVSKSARRADDPGPWKPLGGRGGKTFDEIAAEARRQHHPNNVSGNIQYPTPRSGSRPGSAMHGSGLRGSVTGNTPQMAGTPGGNLRSSMSASMTGSKGLHRSRIPQPDFSPTGGYKPSDRDSDSGVHLMMSVGTRNKLANIYQRKLEDKIKCIMQTLLENRVGLFRLNKKTDNLVRVMGELRTIMASDDELRRLNVSWERAIDSRIERLTNELRALSATKIPILPSSSYFYAVGDTGQSVEEIIEYVLRTDDGDDGTIEDEEGFKNIRESSVFTAPSSINRNVSPEPPRPGSMELSYSNALKRAMDTTAKLRDAVQRNLQLGNLLSNNDNLVNAVLSSNTLFETLTHNPGIVNTLLSNPELVRKVCLYPDMAAVLFQEEPVLQEIAADPTLMDQTAADPSIIEVICKDKSTARKLINALPKVPKEPAGKEEAQDGTLFYEIIVENLSPSSPDNPPDGKGIRDAPSEPRDSLSERSEKSENSVASSMMSLKSRYSDMIVPIFAEGERIKAPESYLKHTYISKVHPDVKAESMCELAAQLIDKADEVLETPETIDTTLTPLMKAAKNNDMKLVKQLVSAHAREQTVNGDTALMFAARQGNIKIVKELLPHEAGMQMKNGDTALISAVRHGQMKAIKMLLAKEAKMQSNDGHTALMHAVLSNRPAFVKLLAKAEHGVQTADTQASALMYSAESGQIPLAKPLVKLEAGKRNIEGKTSMMMAAEQGNLPLVKALMKVEGGMQDNNGVTAMMYAAMNGHKAVCVALNKIEGALKDNSGKTSQDWASSAGHDECTMPMSARTMMPMSSGSGVFNVKNAKASKSFSKG